MHIHCLGLNHTTAPIALRERLDFSEEAVQAALARLGCGGGLDRITGLAILSTCNRVEVYAASSDIVFGELEAFLSEARGVPVEDLRPFLYRHLEEQAVRHLMSVAAGLDSLVIGEPQILGQVTRVQLVDIDSLNERLEISLAERGADIPNVEAIIAEEHAEFMDFLTSLNVLPLIATLHQQAESIRQREVETTLRRLPGLTEAERRHIETMTVALVKKILASPTRRLRAEATSSDAVEYAALVRTLFGLEGHGAEHRHDEGGNLHPYRLDASASTATTD